MRIADRGNGATTQRTYRRRPPIRYKCGDAHRRPARPVPAARPRVVSRRARRADGPAAAGLAAHRRRPEHADPGPDRLRQDAGRLPRLPRSPLAAASRCRAACASSTSRRSRRSTTTSTATCRCRSKASPRRPGDMGQPLPALEAAVRTGDTPHGRAAAPAPPAAARPHHHAGIAAPAADLARPRDAARRHALHRRRDPRPLPQQARRLPRAAAGTAGSAQRRTSFVRIGLSATQRPLDEVARFLGGSELDADGQLRAAAGHHRGCRAAQGPRSARRQSRRAVRAAAGEVDLAVDLPPARRPDPRTSLDHRLRQQSPLRRAHHVVPQRGGAKSPAPITAACRWRCGSRPRRR